VPLRRERLAEGFVALGAAAWDVDAASVRALIAELLPSFQGEAPTSVRLGHHVH
jgi:hypothetical protein